MSAMPSGAMSMRVRTMTASGTGLPLGLCTQADGDHHVVAFLEFGRDRLEGVVRGAGPGGSAQSGSSPAPKAGASRYFAVMVFHSSMGCCSAARDVIERRPDFRASLRTRALRRT